MNGHSFARPEPGSRPEARPLPYPVRPDRPESQAALAEPPGTMRRLVNGHPPPGLLGRRPSMVQYPSPYMIPPQDPGDRGKLCVVLDLDETLVHCMRWPGPICKRPYVEELLEFLGQHCEVCVRVCVSVCV